MVAVLRMKLNVRNQVNAIHIITAWGCRFYPPLSPDWGSSGVSEEADPSLQIAYARLMSLGCATSHPSFA